MASLITIFRDMPDPRRGNAQRHALLDILTSALVASACGAESCVDFAEFAEDREPLLREFLLLENGLPSHDSFGRVLRLLDPAAFGRAFAAFLTDLGADGPGVLAIDGAEPGPWPQWGRVSPAKAAPVLRPRGGPLACVEARRDDGAPPPATTSPRPASPPDASPPSA